MLVLLYFMKAWMVGIAISAPIGPIGVRCIRKTLELGLIGAIAVGFGAAIADSIYGIIAVTGLTAISHFLLKKVLFIKICGGIFLLYLAYKEISSKSNNSNDGINKNKRLGKLTSEVFFLTITNPVTILIFIGVFVSIGGNVPTIAESFAMVVGLFLGSMSWWLILGMTITKIKHKLPESWISRIRYFSAIFLGGFGIYVILGSFHG